MGETQLKRCETGKSWLAAREDKLYYLLSKTMKLHQNQLWRKGDDLYRIVELERLAVKYKKVAESDLENGTHYSITKKEFCRLIKGAVEVV